MISELHSLNEQQLEAVTYNDGNLVIVAAAGSGKTRVITHKIAYQIKNLNIPAWKILAVTFTNKAANEMRTRLASMGVNDYEKVTIVTYHALCAKILRSEISYFNLPSNFSILDTTDQKQLLSGVYKALDISIKTQSYGQAIDYISRTKNMHIEPAVAIDNAKSDNERFLALTYKKYCEETIRLKALDFDDLLIYVWKLFNERPDVAEKWAKKYDQILVDEFQDTSNDQFTIISKLAKFSKLTVVGDPDQTIYTWRNANANLINEFSKRFENVKIIKLELNYRSTHTILEKANKLIEHNKRRVDKKLKATISEGDDVEFFHGASDDDEARWIARRIQSLVAAKKFKWRDVAILYRANYISSSIEKALILENIKYVTWGGIKFYQREEIKNAISFLRIIDNGDEMSLQRMINTPSRRLGSTAQEAIFTQYEMQENKTSLWDFLCKNINHLNISALQKRSLGDFINLILKYRHALKTNPIAVTISKFLTEVGYIQTFNTLEDGGRLENLNAFYKIIRTWEAEHEGLTVTDYLNEVSLLTDRDEEPVSDFVTLTTVHTAKGLEFPVVFIAGFSEEVFPARRSIEELNGGGIEEERRLAYVAITRAKQKLIISDSRGYSVDYRFQKKPSRFLKEMGINIKEMTSEFIAPKSFNDNYTKDRNIIAGDEIEHEKFGQGVVVVVQGETIDVNFGGKIGTKTMMKNHTSIIKVGGK